MKTTVTALISGVTGALLGGVVTGILVYVSLSQERTTAAHSQPQPSTESMLVSNQDSPARVREHVPHEIDPTLFIQSVLEATEFASDFDQSVSMYLLLARAEETDLNRYINESFSISERNQRVAALSIIFGRYGAVNPSEALERALALNQVTLQEKANVIRSIFNEWTVSDLEGAAAALEDLPQQFQYAAISAIMWRSDFLTTDQRIQLAQRIGPSDAWIDNAVASIRSEAAKVDPRSAFYEQIRDTAHTQRRYTELFGIVRNWFEQEGVAILPEIHDALDNPNARRFVLQNLIWNAIGTKTATPVEILNVVTEFPNKQDAQQATEHVFRSWSNLDPKKSFEGSFEFADQLVTRDFRNTLLRAWAAKDYEGLLAEASSLPREYRNPAIVQALGRMSINAPEEAIRYTRNLDTRALRISATDEIVDQWSNADARAAFEWLMSDGLDENNRSSPSKWRSAFTKYLRQDFDAAKAFASTYEGELKDQLIESVASHLIDSDIDRAIEYLPNVKEEDREWLQQQIGNELVSLNPNRALRFGESISKNHRDGYYRSMLNKWARTDLVALHDEIKSVPREYQSIAADAILYQNKNKQYLSDRQIRELEGMTTKEELIVTSGE